MPTSLASPEFIDVYRLFVISCLFARFAICYPSPHKTLQRSSSSSCNDDVSDRVLDDDLFGCGLPKKKKKFLKMDRTRFWRLINSHFGRPQIFPLRGKSRIFPWDGSRVKLRKKSDAVMGRKFTPFSEAINFCHVRFFCGKAHRQRHQTRIK